MENKQSPTTLAKRLEADVRQALRKFEPTELDSKQRSLINRLEQDLTDIKLYTSEYESSDTHEERLEQSHSSNKKLNRAQKAILTLSEYNIFGPVDVAHLSAQIEQIMDGLR